LRELHTPGQLEYRLTARGGLPFPALVNASLDVPELEVHVAWPDTTPGGGGEAVIQGGRLQRQGDASSADRATRPGGVSVQAGADGAIVLALACRPEGGDWIGYAVTRESHAFFRVRPGPVLEATDGIELAWAERWRVADEATAQYAELEPREPLDERLASAFGRLADAFAEEWLWFDADQPLETAIERSRFAGYGYAVHEANLKSARLRTTLQPDGEALRFASLDAPGRDIAALVERHWLQGRRE
jgi:hypothetical protein